MSRYRPPAPQKSPYITHAGMQALQAEETALWTRRRDVVAALSAAAAEGDRSENAEYIYRKKELRELDRRIRYLQKRLPTLTVVAQQPANTTKVFFGAEVALEDLDGEVRVFRIMGPDEFDHQSHYISMDSPMARALLGRSLDEEVSVTTPGGCQTYVIVRIDYCLDENAPAVASRFDD
jgi:transcription elongation factor GreB